MFYAVFPAADKALFAPRPRQGLICLRRQPLPTLVAPRQEIRAATLVARMPDPATTQKRQLSVVYKDLQVESTEGSMAEHEDTATPPATPAAVDTAAHDDEPDTPNSSETDAAVLLDTPNPDAQNPVAEAGAAGELVGSVLEIGLRKARMDSDERMSRRESQLANYLDEGSHRRGRRASAPDILQITSPSKSTSIDSNALRDAWQEDMLGSPPIEVQQQWLAKEQEQFLAIARREQEEEMEQQPVEPAQKRTSKSPTQQLLELAPRRASKSPTHASSVADAFVTVEVRSTKQNFAEVEADALAKLGLTADVVFTFPLQATGGGGNSAAEEAEQEEGNATRQEKAARMRQARASVLLAIKRTGLRCVKHKTRDGKSMIVKITASTSMLATEAQRTRIEMRLNASFNDPERPDVSTYADFTTSRAKDFALKGGRVFSSLERQRLVYSILEAASEHGGAELDLDKLLAEKTFSSCFSLHSAARDDLLGDWSSFLGFRMWPWSLNGKQRRLWPDFGVLEQPITEVRDYFGEKIAFYFAWLEHYTQMLLILMWLSLLTFIIESTERDAAAVMVPVYCVLVVVWTTMMAEMWKRKNAELAYRWDVTTFEEEEQPRPEYLRSYYVGPWSQQGKGAMVRKRGFYGSDRKFIPHDDAPLELVMDWWAKLRSPVLVLGFPMLVLSFILMLVVTLSILTFRMYPDLGLEPRTSRSSADHRIIYYTPGPHIETGLCPSGRTSGTTRLQTHAPPGSSAVR